MAATPQTAPITDNRIEADPNVSTVSGKGRFHHMAHEFSSSTMHRILP